MYIQWRNGKHFECLFVDAKTNIERKSPQSFRCEGRQKWWWNGQEEKNEREQNIFCLLETVSVSCSARRLDEWTQSANNRCSLISRRHSGNRGTCPIRNIGDCECICRPIQQFADALYARCPCRIWLIPDARLRRVANERALDMIVARLT